MATKDMAAGTGLGAAISAATTVYLTDASNLAVFVATDGEPETTANVFAVGCLALDTTNGAIYQNTGTSASPTWSINASAATGVTGPTGATGATGPTGPSGA